MLSTTNEQDPLLSPAIKAIHNDFSNPQLNVASLAKLCNFSECYFRRKFLDIYGVTPKKYLTKKRIEYSMNLLREGILSVSQIAEQCGFNNVFHFSKTFKDTVHITASEYASKNIKREL